VINLQTLFYFYEKLQFQLGCGFVNVALPIFIRDTAIDFLKMEAFRERAAETPEFFQSTLPKGRPLFNYLPDSRAP